MKAARTKCIERERDRERERKRERKREREGEERGREKKCDDVREQRERDAVTRKTWTKRRASESIKNERKRKITRSDE